MMIDVELFDVTNFSLEKTYHRQKYHYQISVIS